MPDNGLRTFAMHSEDQQGGQMLMALNNNIDADAARTAFPFNPARLDPETVARRYLTQFVASPDTPSLAVDDTTAQKLEFTTIGTETVPLTGTKIVKFYQARDKIPVYGSLVTVELGDGNSLLSVNSALGEPTDVDSVARISPGQAQKVIVKHAGKGALPLTTPPRLYFYYDQSATRWRLVYIAKDVRKTLRKAGKKNPSDVPELVDYVIDAHSGALVAELPRSQSVTWDPSNDNAVDALSHSRSIGCEVGSDGTKRLYDPTYNVQTFDFKFQDANSKHLALPGDYVVNPPDPWSAAAVSAHANATEVAQFLAKELKRNGLDDKGGPLISSINCVYKTFGSPSGKEWRNAAWIGNQMIYGQRMVNGVLRSYAVAQDVVAHEITHGLTGNTARLEYQGMTGALNESYSDIFGIIIANYHKTSISDWDWEMGKALSVGGQALRDLSDPAKHGQPAHMDNYQDLPSDAANDWGGVHTNSGIHNKAAYNLITSRKANGNFLFKPQEAAALFYLALTLQLSRTSGFSDSRRGVEISARTLFRNDPEAEKNAKLAAVSQAFEDVGIVHA